MSSSASLPLMSRWPICLCFTASIATQVAGENITLLDQIGPADGTAIDAASVLTDQYFEPAFSAYDIGAVDDFDNPGGLAANTVEMALTGYFGYSGIDGVQGLEVNFYSSLSTAAASLAGDLASERILGVPSIDPDWTLPNFDLVEASGAWPLQEGIVYVSLIPVNEYGTNGHTACGTSSLGNDSCWQTNPGGGWNFGPIAAQELNLAYRVGNDDDPCGIPLPPCHVDVSGPIGEPDGVVGVDDILASVSTFGEIGNGTSRPVGDCFPLPAGDCEVTVDDLLEIIGSFTLTCPEVGACCLSSGDCDSNVSEADCSGNWLGDGTSCASCQSPIIGACCLDDGTCSDNLTPEQCYNASGFFNGEGTLCVDANCGIAPANDTCESALQISEGSTSFDSTWANSDGTYCEDPNDPGCPLCDDLETVSHDVWFTYSASVTGILTLSTCDQADFATVITIYDTDCDPSQPSEACSSGTTGCSNGTATLQYPLMTAGTTYLIQVGTFAEDYGVPRTGMLTLSVEEGVGGACCIIVSNDCYDGVTPADCTNFGGLYMGGDTLCKDITCSDGNTCDDAIVFTEGPNAFDTTELSVSDETDLPDESMCPDTALDWTPDTIDYWGIYEATGAGTVDISLCDASSYDTSLVIYTGASCGSLTQIACNGDEVDSPQGGCQPYYSAVRNVPVDAGTRLWIRIGGWDGATGSGTCTVTHHPQSSFGACCSLDDCQWLFEAACEDLGGQWYAGTNCNDVNCMVSWQPCNTGIGSDPIDPDGGWVARTSDVGFGYVLATNINASSVTDCMTYGFTLIYENSMWAACTTPSGMTMKWTLYADTAGLPGTTLASGTSTTHSAYDMIYSDLYQLQGWTFTPNYAASAEWLEFKSLSAGAGECWFLWMASSDEGDGEHAVQENDGPWMINTESLVDLNFCVTP